MAKDDIFIFDLLLNKLFSINSIRILEINFATLNCIFDRLNCSLYNGGTINAGASFYGLNDAFFFHAKAK